MENIAGKPVEISITDAINELKRELAIRQKKYPEWVENHELKTGKTKFQMQELPFKVRRGAIITRENARKQILDLMAAIQMLENVADLRAFMERIYLKKWLEPDLEVPPIVVKAPKTNLFADDITVPFS